jgi:hypothetical protein
LVAHFKAKTQTEEVPEQIFPLRGRKLRNGLFIIISPRQALLVVRWAGRVTRIGLKKNGYRGLVGKLEGKSIFARTRHRGQYNVKMDL